MGTPSRLLWTWEARTTGWHDTARPATSFKCTSGRGSPTLDLNEVDPSTCTKVILAIALFASIWAIDKCYSHDISWPKGTNGGNFIDWKTFKANGANLGGWLEKEKTHDPIWWSKVGGDAAPDEWTLCQTLGSKCGSTFEARYASFLNTTTIDQLTAAGINTLHIPTTYATGVSYLKTITQYAISKYDMHIIIGIHSLPGSVNNLDIGEALMHDAWFYNATNLAYSFQAIDGILNFIKSISHTNAFTVAPINEASDNLPGFGSADAKVDKRIPLMLQDNFKGASYWAPFYAAGTNLVIDSHVYYFAAAGTYSAYVKHAVCEQASYLAEETKFPVFVWECARKTIFDTQRYAWQKYVAGGSSWTAVSYSTARVDGEGTQRDYWSYIDLINAGIITKATNASYR
ncbi:glycoside hydrolase superfamily [Lophiotrema nucula]|uniref:glucan 1,3-beta-glucosidase n=1 Tax=Lophiotrema nucula TaxID=690887 RepID=A0A6A5YVF9_9PLEO|nr:glycoside hydrolase superfamily [Lophiotrema nucula]